MAKAKKKATAKPKPEHDKKEPRRDWEHNQELIGVAYGEILLKKNGRLPTMMELSTKTGLSMKSVERHLKSNTFKKNLIKLRAAQPYMMAIFVNRVAKSTNSNMWELYWTLTEPEFIKKSAVDVSTKGKALVIERKIIGNTPNNLPSSST